MLVSNSQHINIEIKSSSYFLEIKSIVAAFKCVFPVTITASKEQQVKLSCTCSKSALARFYFSISIYKTNESQHFCSEEKKCVSLTLLSSALTIPESKLFSSQIPTH